MDRDNFCMELFYNLKTWSLWEHHCSFLILKSELTNSTGQENAFATMEVGFIRHDLQMATIKLIAAFHSFFFKQQHFVPFTAFFVDSGLYIFES